MGTALAADAQVPDQVVARHLAVEGMQLEHQVLALELLLESGIVAAGLGHQATKHPQEKTKFHARASISGEMSGAL